MWIALLQHLLAQDLPNAELRPVSTFAGASTTTCKNIYDSSDLLDGVDIIEKGFVDVDLERIAYGKKAVEERLPCILEPMSTTDLARVYRGIALAALAEENNERTIQALMAMLETEPGFDFAGDIIPAGHQLRTYFIPEAGRRLREEAPIIPLLVLKSGWFEVNGVHTTTLKTSIPAFIQRIDGDGKVQETRVYWAGEEIGDWQSTARARNNEEDPPKPPTVVSPRLNIASALWHVPENAPAQWAPGLRVGGGLEWQQGKKGIFLEVNYQGGWSKAVVNGEEVLLNNWLNSFQQIGLHLGGALSVGKLCIEVGPMIALQQSEVVTTAMFGGMMATQGRGIAMGGAGGIHYPLFKIASSSVNVRVNGGYQWAGQGGSWVSLGFGWGGAL